MFQDRIDAGQKLGHLLKTKKISCDLVLGLARGGVVIAAQVAAILQAPFDALIVRKIGDPTNPEYARGAIVGDVILLAPDVLKADLKKVIAKEKKEMERRLKLYGQIPTEAIQNKIVWLVDDGVATGFTMKAAIQFLRQCHAKFIGVAVPVGAVQELKKLADQVVCLSETDDFFAISQFYQEFHAVSDEEVCKLLQLRATKGH